MEGVGGQDAEELDFIFESVHLFFVFLAGTGAWSGPEEHLLVVRSLFHVESEKGGIPWIIAPELTPVQELEGLAGTGLAPRLEALLRWLGTGKGVTFTGALRAKDMEGPRLPSASGPGESSRQPSTCRKRSSAMSKCPAMRSAA